MTDIFDTITLEKRDIFDAVEPEGDIFDQVAPETFDPEGTDYDYATATEFGGEPDETGHWGSLDPRTGMVLKGRQHPTWDLMEQEEIRRGSKIVKRGDRYFSEPQIALQETQLLTPPTGPHDLFQTELPPLDRPADPTSISLAQPEPDRPSAVAQAPVSRTYTGFGAEELEALRQYARERDYIPLDMEEFKALAKAWYAGEAREDFTAIGKDTDRRAKLYGKYFISLGGRVGSKKFLQKLNEDIAKEGPFTGLGLETAGKLGSLALEMKIIYPLLFGAAGEGGKLAVKIKVVSKTLEKMKDISGLAKLAKTDPKKFTYLTQAMKAFSKGDVAGQTLAAVESIGKDKEFGDWIIDMNKRGLLVGGLATIFSLADTQTKFAAIKQLNIMRESAVSAQVKTDIANKTRVAERLDRYLEKSIYNIEQEMFGKQPFYKGKKVNAKKLFDSLIRHGVTEQTSKMASKVPGRPKAERIELAKTTGYKTGYFAEKPEPFALTTGRTKVGPKGEVLKEYKYSPIPKEVTVVKKPIQPIKQAQVTKVTPKAEVKPLAVTREKIATDEFIKDRWDSSKLGYKVELVIRGKWITNKGQITKSGEKFAQSKWDELSPEVQNVVKKFIAEDYNKVLAPTEAVTGEVEIAEKAAEEAKIELEQVKEKYDKASADFQEKTHPYKTYTQEEKDTAKVAFEKAQKELKIADKKHQSLLSKLIWEQELVKRAEQAPTPTEVKTVPEKVAEPIEKEIKHEKEAIIEPATSLEMERRETGKFVPTGKLDPTDQKEAAEIIELHKDFIAGEKGRVPVGGIFEVEFNKETREYDISGYEYTSKQIDTAYRTIQKPIPSPMPDTELFAMPGKEAALQAIAQKMQKITGKAKKKGVRIAKPQALPKAKVKKEDHIKAVYKAAAAESTRYALNGVFIEGENLVATDGRRMFMAKGKWGKDGIYLDKASLAKGLLGKVEKEGIFPKWQDIVPLVHKSDAIIVDDLETVWRRVKQASLLSSVDSEGLIILVNKDGSLGFASASPEIGHAEINIHLGAKILGGVNPQFFLDTIAFHATRGDTDFEFYFEHWERPILTRSSDRKTSTVIMPINIEMEPSDAIKEAIGIEKPKPKGGGAGGAMAAPETKGGYGTIVEPSEKDVLARDAPKVSTMTPEKAIKEAEVNPNITVRALDEVLRVASPAHRTEKARAAARIVRKSLADLAHKDVVNERVLKKAHRMFSFMNREDVLEFIDKMENGERQSNPKLDMISRKFRELLDTRRDIIRGYGKGKLENFIENYFPHQWKNPKKASSIIAAILGRRPLEGPKSFLKKRTIVTVKEGIERGLEPVSYNPVDLVLFKTHEMDRYIMAQNIIRDLKRRGLMQFVYSRSRGPEGYSPINDYAFTVFMPPELPIKEAYDTIMVDKLMDFANSLGIDVKRFMRIGGKRLGYAQWSPFQDKGEKIRTRFASPISVLSHEISHVLGHRYKLYETLVDFQWAKGEYKEITRGKRKGEKRFVATPESIEWRKEINKEYRDLADLRYEGQTVSDTYKMYVRKKVEKEAVLLQAYLRAPQKMKKVAPTIYKNFVKFMNDHAELRPLLDIEPTLALGQTTGIMKVPGVTTLGKYYAPEPVSTILNNYLSPGLKNSPYGVVSGPYDLLRKTGNTLNQANLSLSGFHFLNITTDVMASQLGLGLKKIIATRGQTLSGIINIATVPISPVVNLWRGERLARAYKTELDLIDNPKLKEMVELLIYAGGRSKMDTFYYNKAVKVWVKNITDIIRGSIKEKSLAIAKLPLSSFTAGLEIMAKPLMEWAVPRGKLGLFTLLARHELGRAKKSNLTSEQVWANLTNVWDSVDNRMGQLVYDNLFWNKVLKDALMLAIRSVGWNLGSWREYMGAPIDFFTTFKRMKRGDAWMSHKMSYVIGAAFVYAILGAIIMKLLTGKDPEKPKDYFFPKTGAKNPDGSDERLSLPTYAKDVYAYATRPLDTVRNKTHPIWRVLGDVWSNEDFFGTEIRHEGDPIIDQLKQLADYIGKQYLPFSVRNYQKMVRAGTVPKNAAITSFTGIISAPAYLTRSPAQELAIKYIVDRIPRGKRTKAQFERSRLRKEIKIKLRRGEGFDFEEALQTFTNKEILRIEKESKLPYFAESFKRLSLDEALNVYTISSAREQLQVVEILQSKYKRAKKITPEMKLMYQELIGR